MKFGKNMSRIGKKPIKIPEGVEVKIEGQKVVIKGPKGEISQEVRPEIKVSQREGEIFVSLKKETGLIIVVCRELQNQKLFQVDFDSLLTI